MKDPMKPIRVLYLTREPLTWFILLPPNQVIVPSSAFGRRKNDNILDK